jgi:hypothetical protein
MGTVRNLISHLTSSDETPFDYEIYEQYVSCLLYLVALKDRTNRSPSNIRHNVIIRRVSSNGKTIDK